MSTACKNDPYYNIRINSKLAWFSFLLVCSVPYAATYGQVLNEYQHKRGRLWENVQNDGLIGSMGVWDFEIPFGIGFFPGFKDHTFPIGSENDAYGSEGGYVYSNANFHNFRSGVWIVAKDLLTPGDPPLFTPVETTYEAFLSNLQSTNRGVESDRDPLVVYNNYSEEDGFNPLLPEEVIKATFHTNLGITVNRYSSVWSYPGYRDFIIYDYWFVNDGVMVSNVTGEVVPGFGSQTLKDVYFAFHSGIAVSTKSQINLHNSLGAIAAGAFGWQPYSYHDYYHVYDDGELVFSTNYNGGRAPTPWAEAEPAVEVKDNEAWKVHFGDELMSPAAFGWLTLSASPIGASPRATPAPDVLRIDTHKGGYFNRKPLDIEYLNPSNYSQRSFHMFASTPDTQSILGNNGDRMNFYTQSFGPYTVEPGDTVRIIIAEIAGVMDYREVVAGDPDGYFPAHTIAAIRENAEFARQAVSWGIGAPPQNGIPIAADAPDPPPGPTVRAVNASVGDERPLIRITWDDLAETAIMNDGSGEVFYNGAEDLDGYRIYRSDDFQYSGGPEWVLRGAYWDLVKDIPADSFATYWDPALQLYTYDDELSYFGEKYGYYVSAYYTPTKTWTSANLTQVSNLPELESGDHNRTPPTRAQPGPLDNFDIYVAPNPFVLGTADRSFGRISGTKYLSESRIEFRNLPAGCTIRIYTISGDLLRVLEHAPDQYGNLSGSEVWDLRSEAGLEAAPGLYIYHIESKDPVGTFVDKLMIIR